jgi:hypothetical protein
MRTPGRCTNVEGCWLGASRRDVWAAVGDDFVCPNCRNPLVPPGRKALSRRGLRRAALMGVLLLAVVSAGAVAAVKLSPLAVATARPVLAALLNAPRRLISGQVFGMPHAMRGALAGRPPAAAAATRLATTQPAQGGAAKPSPRQRYVALAAGVAAAPSPPPAHRPVGTPVVLYNALVDDPARLSQLKPTPRPVASVAEGQPVAVSTLLSETTLVVPPSAAAPVVLPITFGRPIAPENDLAPLRLHWRYHGLVATPRRSVFHAEPSESVEAMCRTLEPLQ